MYRAPPSTNPADARAALHRLIDELPNSLLESARRSIEYLCRQGATMEGFTFGGVPYETSPDSGGNYRDLDAIREASVTEIPDSDPRHTIIDLPPGRQAELPITVRVRAEDWERFQALREQREGVHRLVFDGKTCNAQLAELHEQQIAATDPGKVSAFARFIKLPRDYDPAETLDWETGRR